MKYTTIDTPPKDPYQSVFENQIEHDSKMYDIYNHDFPNLMRLSDEEHVDYEFKVYAHILAPRIKGFQEFIIAIDERSQRESFIIEATTDQNTKLIFNCTNRCTTEGEKEDIEIMRNGECIGLMSDERPDVYVDIMHLNINGDDIVRSKWMYIDDSYLYLDDAINCSIDVSSLEKNKNHIRAITQNVKKEYERLIERCQIKNQMSIPDSDPCYIRDVLGILYMVCSHDLGIASPGENTL